MPLVYLAFPAVFFVQLIKNNLFHSKGWDTQSDFTLATGDLPLVTSDKSHSVSPQKASNFRLFSSLVCHFQTCWKTGNFLPSDFQQSLYQG